MSRATLATLVALAPARLAVGDWTFPYRKPRGTPAAKVERIEGDVLFLSDGSEMHWSYARKVAEGSVAS